MNQIPSNQDYYSHLVKESFFGKIYRSFILYPVLRLFTGSSFLDVGCGIGRMLSKGHPSSCLGIDINYNAIMHCRNIGLSAHLIPQNGLFPLEANAFHVVICDQVIEHLSSPRLLLSEIFRVLRPRGRLIVGVPCKKGFYSDPDHKTFYTKETLLSILRSFGFTPFITFYFPFPFAFFGNFFTFQYLYVILHKD